MASYRTLGQTCRTSAIFGVLLALRAISAASFDWLMSLEPASLSTIFGIYRFAGLFRAALLLIVLVILLRRMGYLRNVVNENHLHNLGQWLIARAFGVLGLHLVLAADADLVFEHPEETSYFLRGSEGEWWALSYVVNPIMNFAIPFLALLPRPGQA